LAKRDISDWRLSAIPETAFKKQLKMNSVPGPIQMLMEIYTGEYTQGEVTNAPKFVTICNLICNLVRVLTSTKKGN